MIIITAIQTGFCFMTISPELFKQFNRLVDLAVVTNIMPYLLSMAAVAVIMKVAKVEPSKAKLYNVIAASTHSSLPESQKFSTAL